MVDADCIVCVVWGFVGSGIFEHCLLGFSSENENDNDNNWNGFQFLILTVGFSYI